MQLAIPFPHAPDARLTLTAVHAAGLGPAEFYYALRERSAGRPFPALGGGWTDEQIHFIDSWVAS